jgi:putative membrane protein
MDYNYVKALHIIFVVCWFAALFYIVRLFIYATEAQNKDAIARPILTNQLILMQKKLWYIIGWPAMIGTFIFGLWMLALNPLLLKFPWMWLKLISVVLLALYHVKCQSIYKQQKDGIYKHNSFKLRLFNALATLFLVAIVFLVVIKSSSGLLWGLLGLIAFAGILMLAVKIYRSQSKKIENTTTTKNINPVDQSTPPPTPPIQ